MSRNDGEGSGHKRGFFGLVPSRRSPVAPAAPSAPSAPSAAVPAIPPATDGPDWNVVNSLPLTSQASGLALSEQEKRLAWAQPEQTRASQPAVERDEAHARSERMAEGLRRMRRDSSAHGVPESAAPAVAPASGASSAPHRGTEAAPATASAPAPQAVVATATRASRKRTAAKPAASTPSTEQAKLTAPAPEPAKKRQRAPKPVAASSRETPALPTGRTRKSRTQAAGSVDTRINASGDTAPESASVRQVFSRLRTSDQATAAPPAPPADTTKPSPWPAFLRKTDRS